MLRCLALTLSILCVTSLFPVGAAQAFERPRWYPPDHLDTIAAALRVDADRDPAAKARATSRSACARP